MKSLMSYFGETPDEPEGTKPEDFFNLILSFSTMLRVSDHLCQPSDPNIFYRKQRWKFTKLKLGLKLRAMMRA